MASFGLLIFPTAYSIQPADLARTAEGLGFDSIWFIDHTHAPASRRTPYPAGGDLPKEYWANYDQLVALMAAAAVTTRLKLGTAITLMSLRDPLVTAKQVATLDVLSGGRVLFGVGAGWNAEEMENHGTPYRLRWPVVRERVLAMKELWTKDAAEFHGKYVNFDPVWIEPKPAQKGGPPVILGAFGGDHVFKRIAEYGDGWIPLNGFVPEGWRGKLDAALAERGRKPSSVTTTLASIFPGDDFAEKAIADGFDRVVFTLPSEPREKLMPLIEQYAATARRFGQVPAKA
jgi:probable F420-dependent oxidoreductase